MSEIYDIYTNLFPLQIKEGKIYEIPASEKNNDSVFFEGKNYSTHSINSGKEVDSNVYLVKTLITKQFANSLHKLGYKFNGKYKAFRESDEINQTDNDVFHLFTGFEFRILQLENNLVLCLEPKIVLRFSGSIDDLVSKGIEPNSFKGFFVRFSDENNHQKGYLEGVEQIGEQLVCRIIDYNGNSIKKSAQIVVPDPRPEVIELLLRDLGRNPKVISLQRKYSFLDSPTSSKDRLSKTLDLVKLMNSEVFPLKFGGFEVSIAENPMMVKV